MTRTILDELLAVRAAVCWVGNAGWLIRGGGRLIALDPDLDSRSRLAKPPVTAGELAPALDAAFITHEHGDHFNEGTGATLAAKSECVFVVPANCVEKARAIGVSEARIVVARPRQPLKVAGLGVQPTRAFHGHAGQVVYRDANLDDCGYLLDVAGLTIFQPGDSVLTQDHLALTGVDALFVSPTSHNMHVAPAATLIAALAPRWIFPQHFGTYAVTADNDFWTVGYPDELLAALPADLRPRYHRLRQGEVFVLDAP